MKSLLIIGILLVSVSATPPAATESRYFYSGDGVIDIATFKGTYRDASGKYVPSAVAKIRKAYGGPMEIRLIEFFDYLQDHFKGGKIRITSGYRSPTYNTSLRNKGKLAGKASMHQYAMAADIRMKGVHPKKVWKYVRDLNYGGAGYYHGSNIHLDVGPARFWDETSSKVGSGHADENKLITLIQDKDIYHPGEDMTLRFVRMTTYPIGVSSTFVLERQKGDGWKPTDSFEVTRGTSDSSKVSRVACPKYSSIAEMKNFHVSLPQKLKPGRYRMRTTFCGKEWEAMPDEITSYEFEIKEQVAGSR